MKQFATCLAALALCGAVASTSSATVLVSEGFSYANGNLIGNGGWLLYSPAVGVTDIQVVTGRAVGGGATNPQNDDHKLFAAQSLLSTTYACFEVTIPVIAAAPKAIYFFALKDGGAANLVSRVYVLPITGGFTFGLSHSSTSTTVGVVAWSTSTLLYDHSYRIVVNYDPVAKTSTMWVDPVTQASTSVSITNTAIAALAVSSVALRQSIAASTLPASPSYAGSADWTFSVDNLGVGTSFTDACFQVTPTEGKTWGQIKTLYR